MIGDALGEAWGGFWLSATMAIGGVTLESAPEVIRAGATTVAVISDLLAGGDPAARVRAYVARLTV